MHTTLHIFFLQSTKVEFTAAMYLARNLQSTPFQPRNEDVFQLSACRIKKTQTRKHAILIVREREDSHEATPSKQIIYYETRGGAPSD
jgi:hypothetical protein